MRIYATSAVVFTLFGSISISATVELNVVPSSRAPFNAGQQWVQALSKLRSVRVRSGSAGTRAQPEVKRRGNTVYVTGVIDANNRLVVPEKRFSIRQIAALEGWLAGQQQIEAKEVSKDRFGLSSAQLSGVHNSLKLSVSKSTKEQNVSELVASLADGVGYRLRVDLASRQQMQMALVDDQWQGFSSGTVMAAVLRPLGLGFVPRATKSSEIEMVIVGDAGKSKSWPVGWPSPLKNRELVPRIYDPLPIEVNETPIGDVMSALESRLATPVRYDTALLKSMGLDPAATKVTYSASRTIYAKAMSQTLFKAKMKYELRVDERGKPFFWITPRRVRKSQSDFQ